jgi:hypothetical protein
MYMLHHESHVPVHLHYESHLLPPCNDKAHRFSHYFENIGEIAAAASTTSMTSPDQVAAPRQNHREGTGSRASLLGSHDRYAGLVGNGSGHGPALISLLSARSEQLRRAIH